jgi:hypothetical protein
MVSVLTRLWRWNVDSIPFLVIWKPIYWYCCFSAKHASFEIKNKDWLVLNQDNVSEWNDGAGYQWIVISLC